ncbi:MAG: metal ABC transporter substrate-binding protein [Mariprofundaceae bacterium]
MPVNAHAKPIVVATVPALGQIAQAIGGPNIKVHVLTRAGQDAHVFYPKPGQADVLSRADLLISAGFGLEGQWLPSLLKLVKNPKIRLGSKGFFTGEDAIEAVGVLRGMSSKSLKKWSPEENPFWWMDPENGIKVATMLALRLGEVDPVHEGDYLARAEDFSWLITRAIPRWKQKAAALKGPVITYHNSYNYFIKAMDIELAGFIEPMPGIEPSTRHLDTLIRQVKEKRIAMIWVEPYHLGPVARRLAKESGVRLLVLPVATDGRGVDGYMGMFDKIVLKIERWSQ